MTGRLAILVARGIGVEVYTVLIYATCRSHAALVTEMLQLTQQLGLHRLVFARFLYGAPQDKVSQDRRYHGHCIMLQ